MKALLMILPVVGAAWLAFSAEPASPANTSSPPATPDSVAPPVGPQPSDPEHYATAIGERLAESGSLTARTERAEKDKLLQLLNPFAPMKPVPESPWLSRAAWSTAAAEEHAGVPRPIETNREVKVKVVVWRD